MPLRFRLAVPADYPRLEEMVIESFASITWFRKVDELFGPLNGRDWRSRWQLRLKSAFTRQTVLIGEEGPGIVAYASGSYDPPTRSAYIDLLAVDPRCQGKGYGRDMLRAIVEHFRQQGAEHAHLDCLLNNQAGNQLYESEGFQKVAEHARWWLKIP
ncbi:MAG: GNAT family N-acetyltransferase [Acidobacteria bacterium]|nr:GNAT family N-acetyltransferase [Acidobacteriota bacterium]